MTSRFHAVRLRTLRRAAGTLARSLAWAGMLAPLHASHLAAQGRGAKAAAKPVADSLALEPQSRQSWTSDRMRFQIGDIVTIMISERTQASANLTDNNSAARQKQLGLDIEPPASPTGASTSMTATMDFNNVGDSRKRGAVLRQNDFRSFVSARVIAVSSQGILQIRGHKLVDVDRNQQDVVITGWVRPQDITVGANTVESARIADAEIHYAQKGALGRPRSGVISRMLGALWP
jgi:flagellar L-ring protein precursor FlgH